MSKLFITNNDSAFAHTLSVNQDFFPKYSTFVTEVCSAVFYEKKNYSLGNVYRDETGNFIGIVGTYLYKESFGAEAARRILADFDGDIVRMKKEVQGMFSALIYKTGQIVIFNDYYGLYDTFYHVDETGHYVIATSLKDLLLEISSIAIDEFPFMMEVFHTGCFDEHTPFKNIWKLRGNAYLLISSQELHKQELGIKSLDLGIVGDSNKEEVLEYLKQTTTCLAKAIARQFSHVALCATGGLDSRTLMATYAAIGAKVHLLHGRGNSLLTATCPEDAQIVTAIASRMGWTCSFMNWKHPEVTEDVDWDFQKHLGEAYGFYNRSYVGNRNFFSELANGSLGAGGNFVDFGYNIEALRLRSGAENIVDADGTFALDTFVHQFYLNARVDEKLYPNLHQFEEYVFNLWQDYLHALWSNGATDKIPIDLFERLRWADTRYSGTRIYMLVNEFTYSFPLYCVPSVQEMILSLPAEWIKDAKFQTAYIHTLSPQLMELPIFSHRRKMRLMRDGRIKMTMNAKNIATNLLQRIPVLSAPVLDLYRRIKYKDYGTNWDKVQAQLEHLHDDEVNAIVHVKAYPQNCVTGVLYQLRQFLIVYHLVRNRTI